MTANKPLPFLPNLEIIDAGAEGKGVARYGDMVVFVPYTAPGDHADVQVLRKKKSFAEGKLVTLRKGSEMRTEPVCSHFGICGGCSWQHLKYEHQLEFKRQQVFETFRRIGKFAFPEVPPALPSALTTFYRNKLEFTFSNRRWLTGAQNTTEGDTCRLGLGFHMPGMFDRILDIDYCYLQAEPSNHIRNAIRQFAISNRYPFYDQRQRTGFLRNLIIRNSSGGEVMVILVVNEYLPELLHPLLDFVVQSFAEVTSLYYVINPKLNDSISDLLPVLYFGKPALTERLGSLKFMIGPLSFYQTNSLQTHTLYQTIREFAGLRGHETVYDFYCGTGTISCFVASGAGKVIGVEYVDAAVRDALLNAASNGMRNVHFEAGDILKAVDQRFVDAYGTPEVVITDPPRSGMHEGVIRKMIALAPKTIVYVSCNPATQARDIALLGPYYRVERVQPVDMFPHTTHIENVVLLSRTDEISAGQELPSE